MAISNNVNILKEVSKELLECGDDFLTMKLSVEILYKIFNSITGIDINKLNEGDIHLPTGKAISPSSAAHCLLELKRTAIFLRGIKQAIEFKIDGSTDLVRILYAGCGPYATLVTPLLHYFLTDRISVTFFGCKCSILKCSQKAHS